MEAGHGGGPAASRRKSDKAYLSLQRGERCSSKSSIFWLDYLPADVRKRIATYLLASSSRGITALNISLLSLAETTADQRDAVVAALTNRLEISKGAGVTLYSRWASVFDHRVQDLTLLTVIPEAATLIESPNLLRATVINRLPILKALPHARRLRHLELQMAPCIEPPHHHTLRALRALSLDRLALNCQVLSVKACLFTTLETLEALVAICQQLKSLNIVCNCNHAIHPIWRLLPQLPGVRHLALDRRALSQMPRSMIPKLQNMASVTLDGGEIDPRIALQIGTPVIRFRSGHVDSHAIATLKGCPHLEDLTLSLENGAESALPNLMKCLPTLKRLHLRGPQIGEQRNCGNGDILQAVRNAPHLRGLKLMYLRVDVRELVDILKFMGGRLKEFGTTVDERDPTQLGKIAALLKTAACFNTGLKKFDVESNLRMGKRPCHWPSVSCHAAELRTYYNRLQLHAPGVQSWSLEQYISLLETDVLSEVFGTS